MKLLKSKSAKKKKLEKQIRSVDPEIVKQMLNRYQRFCMDQHAFTWLSWRMQYFKMQLNKKQKLCFRLRLAMKKASSFKLFTKKGEVNLDPETLGRQIDVLPPCLDPDLPAESRNHNALSERYITGLNELSLLDGYTPLEMNDLFENYPVQVDFYPSERVLHQLLMKSIQISENWEEELWIGFKKIKAGGCCKGKVYFAPKKMLHGSLQQTFNKAFINKFCKSKKSPEEIE